jgi:hypothetical protein
VPDIDVADTVMAKEPAYTREGKIDKEIGEPQGIDLPTVIFKNACGVSDSDQRLPKMSESSTSSSEDEEKMYYECEATGYRATEAHWEKINNHNKKWGREYRILKTEYDSTMHAPVVTAGQELSTIITCFKGSRELERTRYEWEKKRNDERQC